VGRAFGVLDPPVSVAAVDARIEAMRSSLRPHRIIGEFLQIVSRTSPLGPPGRPLQPLLVRAAIDLLTPSMRRDLKLPERPLTRTAVLVLMRAFATAAALAPPVIVSQARRRVGRKPPASGDIEPLA
jgi:uncharacterized protein (DUF2236 family)